MKITQQECLCCGCKLNIDITLNPLSTNSVDDGLFFSATGNYGSKLFDPIDGNDFLGVVICDACLKERKHKILQFYNVETRRVGNARAFVVED